MAREALLLVLVQVLGVALRPLTTLDASAPTQPRELRLPDESGTRPGAERRRPPFPLSRTTAPPSTLPRLPSVGIQWSHFSHCRRGWYWGW